MPAPPMLTDSQIILMGLAMTRLARGDYGAVYQSERLHHWLMKQSRMGYRWLIERIGSMNEKGERVFSLISSGYAPTTSEIAELPYITRHDAWGVYFEVCVKWDAEMGKWVLVVYVGESGKGIYGRWTGHISNLTSAIEERARAKQERRPQPTLPLHYSKMNAVFNPNDRFLASRYSPLIEISEADGGEEGLFEDGDFEDVVILEDPMPMASQAEYQVDGIKGHHILDGRLYLHVKYAGHPVDPTEAQPPSSFSGSSHFLTTYLSTISSPQKEYLRRFYRVDADGEVIDRRRPVLTTGDRMLLAKSLEGVAIWFTKREQNPGMKPLGKKLWGNGTAEMDFIQSTNDRQAWYAAGKDEEEELRALVGSFRVAQIDRVNLDRLYAEVTRNSPPPIILAPDYFGAQHAHHRTQPTDQYDRDWATQSRYFLSTPLPPQTALDNRTKAMMGEGARDDPHAEAKLRALLRIGVKARLGRGGVVEIWEGLVISFPVILLDGVKEGDEVVLWLEARSLNHLDGLLIPALTVFRLLTPNLSFTPRLTPVITLRARSTSPSHHPRYLHAIAEINQVIRSHRKLLHKDQNAMANVKWDGVDDRMSFGELEGELEEVLELAGEIEGVMQRGRKVIGLPRSLSESNNDIFVIPCCSALQSNKPSLRHHLLLLQKLLNSPPTIRSVETDGSSFSAKHHLVAINGPLNLSNRTLPQTALMLIDQSIHVVFVELEPGAQDGMSHWGGCAGEVAARIPGLVRRLLIDENAATDGRVGNGFISLGFLNELEQEVAGMGRLGLIRRADGMAGSWVLGGMVSVLFRAARVGDVELV